MTDEIQWGIVGTGSIATRFVDDLRLLPDHRVAAVGSRRSETAAGVRGPRRCPARIRQLRGGVCRLRGRGRVRRDTAPVPRARGLVARLRCRQARVVRETVHHQRRRGRRGDRDRARRGLFCMEAMWTRFAPHMRRIRELLDAGALGDIRTVIADHGQRFLPPDFTSRLYAPELGGGALLDLGIYPLSFASYVLGRPEKVTAAGDLTETGVDAQTSVVLQYEGGSARRPDHDAGCGDSDPGLDHRHRRPDRDRPGLVPAAARSPSGRSPAIRSASPSPRPVTACATRPTRSGAACATV